VERSALHLIGDDELLARLTDILNRSRRTEAELVAHLAEVDERKLYARAACPSMFAYCVEVLHLSEAEAYLRIAAARASREHPLLLEMLADGRLHLSGIGKLAPHLTQCNAALLLTHAAHKTKRQIEELIAAHVLPRRDVPGIVRKLPGRDVAQQAATISSRAPDHALSWGLSPASADRPVEARGMAESATAIQLRPGAVEGRVQSVVEPLSAGRYKVQFTASAALKDKLRRLQALMGRASGGDIAAVIEAAVTEKLERLEARRFALTAAPRKARSPTVPTTRHIPADVRRAVYARDGSRCGYRDGEGRRCSERDRLEFHHRHPFALGGDHSPANVGLLCRAHNLLMAEADFGRRVLSHARGS